MFSGKQKLQRYFVFNIYNTSMLLSDNKITLNITKYLVTAFMITSWHILIIKKIYIPKFLSLESLCEKKKLNYHLINFK